MDLAKKIDRHEIFVMAAALAYTTALTLAPFILIILSLLGLLNQNLQQEFTTQLGSSVGTEVRDAVAQVMVHLNSHPRLNGISGLVGFVILVISASTIFSQLRIAIDKINEFKLAEDINGIVAYFKNKFLSLGLVLGFAFLSIASLIITTFISMVYPSSEVTFWKYTSDVIHFIIFAFLFTALYRFVPSNKLGWKKSSTAGVVSTVFYLIGKGLISLYLSQAGLASMYGAAGSLIVFLAWAYYMGLTMLLSYEISMHFFNDRAQD
jgi:membrane protein